MLGQVKDKGRLGEERSIQCSEPFTRQLIHSMGLSHSLDNLSRRRSRPMYSKVIKRMGQRPICSIGHRELGLTTKLFTLLYTIVKFVQLTENGHKPTQPRKVPSHNRSPDLISYYYFQPRLSLCGSHFHELLFL